jgi:hypothetical protein
LHATAVCGILFDGEFRKLPRRAAFFAVPDKIRVKSKSTGNTPVHPGNAKQAMEPATLWFERRAH